MSTNTTSGVDVDISTVSTTVQPTEDLVTTNQHCVTAPDPECLVEGYKKEYSIVGDALYASLSEEETPPWLTEIIDNVVYNSVRNGLYEYELLMQDIHNAIDALDVAKNTYVEQVNFDASVDAIVASRLQTLNATIDNTFATITDLNTAVANADYALTQRVQDLTSSFSDDLDTRISSVETAYTDADSALASDINDLTSTFESQEESLSAIADATQGLQTYVGLDTDGNPNGTGLLSSVVDLQAQVDGTLQYWFTESTADPKDSWTTEEKPVRDGDVWYQTDTNESYYYVYVSDTWMPIRDADALEAIQNAANAQAAADGKVSQFYAWGGISTPADYVRNPSDPVEDQVTIPGSNFKYWYKSDGKLYYYPSASWEEVPTAPGSSIYIADGDLLVVFDPDTRDTTAYSYNGTSWQQTGPNGIISQSKFFVDLENEVLGSNGHVATSLNALEIDSQLYADNAATSVQNKFAYDSTVSINDVYYKAGFGLTAEAISTQTGDGLTPETAYDSEFWINANKFRFTNDDHTGSNAPFSIDTSGVAPEVTFNGKVTFGSSQTGSVDDAIYAAISTIPLGDKNVNITDNLIPTISFVLDEDHAGYQINGNVTKVTTSGVDTFAEAQATLDTNGELYSPYSDELQIPYYYRFAIQGTTDFSQFGIYEVDSDENVNTQYITYALESGVTLNSSSWYIVEGIVNPYGGNSSDYDGVIRTPDNTKVGTVQNLALSSNPALFVLGWVAGGIPIKVSRMKLAPITADTVAINNTLNYVDEQVDGIDISGDILASQNTLAQNLGYADYAELQAAATLGNTVINGGYLNTDLIEVDAISATQISAVDLSAVSAEVGELNMTAYPSYIRHSKGQVLDTGNAGFWLGVDSAGKAGFAIGDSDQFLRYHPDIGLQIAGSEIVAVNIGDVAFVNNNPGSYTFTNNTLKYTQFSFRMVGGGGGGGPSGGSGGSSSISVPGGSSYTASGGSGGNSLNNYSRAGRDAGITIVSYRDGDGGQGGYIASFDFDLSYEGGYAGQVVTGNLTIPLGGTVNIVVGNYGSATGSGGSTPGYAGAVELVIEGV